MSTERVFLFVGFEQAKDLKAKLITHINTLGASYLLCEDYRKNCTHLVCVQPWPVCKQKFLSATVSGTWIVVPEYITDSNKLGYWLQEEDYEWGRNTRKSISKIDNRIPQEVILAPQRHRSLIKETGQKLFHDWVCAVIIEDDRKRQAYEVILACGGAKILKPRLPVRNKSKSFKSATHLFVEKHIPNESQLFIISEGGLLTSTDFIRSSILNMKPPNSRDFDVTKYLKNQDSLATPSKYCFSHRELKISITKIPDNELVKWQELHQDETRQEQHADEFRTEPNPIEGESETKPFEVGKIAEVEVCKTAHLMENKRYIETARYVSPTFTMDSEMLDKQKQTYSESPKPCKIRKKLDFSPEDHMKTQKRIPVKEYAHAKPLPESSDQNKERHNVKQVHQFEPEKKKLKMDNPIDKTHGRKSHITKKREKTETTMPLAIQKKVTKDIEPPKPLTIEKKVTKDIEQQLNQNCTPDNMEDDDGLDFALKEFVKKNMPQAKSQELLPQKPASHSSSKKDAPKHFPNLFKCCIENDDLASALRLAMAFSNNYYPTIPILSTVVRFILQNPDDMNSVSDTSLLLSNYLENSPPTNSALRVIYYESLCTYKNDSVTPWKTLSEIISGSILNHTHCRKLLEFYVEIFEIDFKEFLLKSKNPLEISDKKLMPIMASIIWHNSTSIGTVSNPCIELIAFIAQAISLIDIFDELQFMFRLLGMIAECIRLAESNFVEGRLRLQQSILVNTIVTKIQIPELHTNHLTLLLGDMKPTWLRLAVSTQVLSNLPFIHFRANHQYANDPISLRKIVCYYFKPSLSPFSPEKAAGHKLCASPIKRSAVNKRNCKGETQLHFACIKNEVERLKTLLNVTGIDVNVRDFAGWTPLHEASNRGHIECIRVLLDWRPQDKLSDKYGKNNLDLYAISEDGITALHDAVLNNHLEVAELLISKGGKKLANFKSKDGSSPWDLARTEEMVELFDRLMTSSNLSSSQESQQFSQDEVDLLDQSKIIQYLTLVVNVLESYQILHQIEDIQDMVVAWGEHSKKEFAMADCLLKVTNSFRKREVGPKELLQISGDLAIFAELENHIKEAIVAWSKLTSAKKDELWEIIQWQLNTILP